MNTCAPTPHATARFSDASVRNKRCATRLAALDEKTTLPPILPHRRSLLLSGVGALVSTIAHTFPLPSAAAADPAAATTTYVDDVDLYSVTFPSNWIIAKGNKEDANIKINPTATRQVVAFYPPGDATTNVSVVCTQVGADYQKMGSFGNPFDFGSNLVNPLLRVKARENAPTQNALLLDAEKVGDKYVIEYAVSRPADGFNQHLISSAALGYNGKVNRLFTLTAVCPEEQFEAKREELRRILDSFVTPPTLYG